MRTENVNCMFTCLKDATALFPPSETLEIKRAL